MAGIAESMADVFGYVRGRFEGRPAGIGTDRWWQPIGPAFGEIRV